MSLSDPFIQSPLEKIDSPHVLGVGIVGSYARGQEARYSDVDFDIFVSQQPEDPYDRHTLRYWDDKLVSLKYTLLEDERSALTDPRRAIWAVPGLQGMKILLDKDGSLAALQKAAQGFQWSQFQSRGVTALKLYAITANLLDELIPEKHCDVVNKTLRLIKEADYL